MENREAIEWFKNRIYVMPESETKEMFRMAISALEKQEADRWIPVTERLPKSDGKYLVTEQFSNVFPPEVNVLCFATDLNKVKR